MVAAFANPVDFAKLVAQKPLNLAEQMFVARMAEGKRCILGETRPGLDDKNAPAIRADLIRFFVWGGSEEKRILGNRIYLQGAHVSGELDLEYHLSSCMLVMALCHFNDEVKLAHSGFRFLSFAGSRLTQGLSGTGMQIGSGLAMSDGFSSDKSVVLLDASIGHGLFCENGKFNRGEGEVSALGADRIRVGANVVMKNSSAKGGARFPGAKIGGYLTCDGGQFFGYQDGAALVADEVKIESHLFMREGFWADGRVSFSGVEIKGNVCCRGKFGDELVFENANIGKDLDCRNGQFEDTVFFDGANVGGDFYCRYGKFKGEFNANTIKVGGNVHFDGFFAAKPVYLMSADIDGAVFCVGGRFSSGLFAGGAKIKQMLAWRNVKGAGDVHLEYASADIFADDVESLKRFRFDLRGFSYTGFVNPLESKSRIDWLSRRPDGTFAPQPFEQAAKVLVSMGRNKDARDVLFAMNQRITEEQGFPKWRKLRQKAWKSAQAKWQWLLDKTIGYNILRQTGRIIWASWRWLLEKTTGYNYSLWRMARASAAIIIAGWIIFGAANERGYIVPHQTVVLTKPDYQQIVRNEKAHVDKCAAPKRPRLRPTEAAECLFPGYPRFDALWFSMDIFLPTSPLHQEVYWYPHPRADDAFWRYLLLGWYWFQVISGWVLTSIFALTITGIMQRSQASWSGK